jgi:hypothetical protein
MNGKPNQQLLEDLAQQTTMYFRERKEELRI